MDRLIRTIKAVSIKKKEEGEIGFLTEEEAKWYNIKAPEDALELLLKEVISKGNVVEFELDNGFPKNFTLKEKAKPEQGKKDNWAEDMTNFEDLLTASHEKGLISITTELIGTVDFEKKRAVFKATVKGMMIDEKKQRSYEGTFTGYGDAEGITNEKIKVHWIRMAESRAIVRALRWYTNNANVAIEETGE